VTDSIVYFGAPAASICPRIARFVGVNRISQNVTNITARLVSGRDTSYCDKQSGRDTEFVAETMSSDTRAAARQFVRSLNILLKFARLYEFGHVRTAAQFETTWKEIAHRARRQAATADCYSVHRDRKFYWTGSRWGPQQQNAALRNCSLRRASRAFTSLPIWRNRSSHASCARFRPAMQSRHRWLNS